MTQAGATPPSTPQPATPQPGVDLSTLGGGTAGPAPPPPPPEDEGQYDPSKDRELIRGHVALILTWCLVGIVAVLSVAGLVTSVACMSGATCQPATIELKTISTLATIVLTPLVGLVGAVTGFYFGEKAGRGAAPA